MRAWHISLPTAALPDAYSQYPNLRTLFGLTRTSNSSRPRQGRNAATTNTSQPPNSSLPMPNFESVQSSSGHTDASERECVVCSIESEIAMKVPTEACTHPPQVCIQCLRQVILAAINSGDFILGVLCPSYGCPHRLGYYDVQKWATEEVFERYDKLLLQDSLRTSGSYIFCVAPNCTAGQEHTGGEDNVIVTCHHCGTKQCFRHQVLWHDGLTCDQWDAQQRAIASQQEKRTEEWIQAGTKACPGPGCGKRIQKRDGCDHMTCQRPGGCGHQFCWECLAPWLHIIAGDNSRHYDNCRYYTGLPGRNPAPTQGETANTTTVRAPPEPQTAPPRPMPTPSPPQPRPWNFREWTASPPPPPPPLLLPAPRVVTNPPRPMLTPSPPRPRPWNFREWTPSPPLPAPPLLLPAPRAFTNPFVPIRTPPLSAPQQSEPPRPGPIRSAWRTTEFPTRDPPPLIPQNTTLGSGTSSAEPSILSQMLDVTNPSEMYRPLSPPLRPSIYTNTNNATSIPPYAGFSMGGLPQSQNAAVISSDVPSASPLRYNAPSSPFSTGISGLSQMISGVPAPLERHSPHPSSPLPIAHNSTTSTRWYTENMTMLSQITDAVTLSQATSSASLLTNNTPSASLSSDRRTVTQIRNAATMKTNNSVKGASPLVAMRALQRLAETAHLKEQQGDLRGALFQFVQVGVLLRFVQHSHAYTREVQNGRQGELYQLMQEFITGPFQGMLKSVHTIQQTLLWEERAEAEIPSASSNAEASSLNRPAGGLLGDRLRQLQGTSIQADYGRRNQVPLMGDIFHSGMPTLHGPVPGPSTNQRSPAQIPPYNPMVDDAPGSSSIGDNHVITPQKLRLCLERGILTILMLDVRSRAQFERERINHHSVVCLNPMILMRPDINIAMIERSQVISPSSEQVLFKNRSSFDLVIMYDEDSTNLGYPTSPMSLLWRAIFMRGVSSPLKRSPMILAGGLAAWKAAIGDEGVIRRPASSSVDPELMEAFLPGTSLVEEETFLYPRPTCIRYVELDFSLVPG